MFASVRGPRYRRNKQVLLGNWSFVTRLQEASWFLITFTPDFTVSSSDASPAGHFRRLRKADLSCQSCCARSAAFAHQKPLINLDAKGWISCGEYVLVHLGEMGAESGVLLPPLFAPFTPHARQRPNSESLPPSPAPSSGPATFVISSYRLGIAQPLTMGTKASRHQSRFSTRNCRISDEFKHVEEKSRVQ
jgi:hypothetical protein